MSSYQTTQNSYGALGTFLPKQAIVGCPFFPRSISQRCSWNAPHKFKDQTRVSYTTKPQGNQSPATTGSAFRFVADTANPRPKARTSLRNLVSPEGRAHI